jgi:hypothetical protein
MDTRGPTPRVGIAPADDPELAGVLEQPGPFLSLQLTTEAKVENASPRNVARWKNVRRELEEAGVPAGLLGQIDGIVPDAHHWGQTLGLVANNSGVLLTRSFAELPERESVWQFAPLPSVAPMIEWDQRNAAHLVVVVDRAGAEITGWVHGRRELEEEDVEHDRHDPHLRKTKPGGWSQRKFQDKAENIWEEDAERVAQRVAELYDEFGARVVIVAGEVRARALLKEKLRSDVAARLKEAEGEADDAEVKRLVATAVAEDTVALIEKFKEERGQHDRAAAGATATLRALAAAQVDTLLVANDPDDDRTAFFGPDLPNAVAPDEGMVKDMGIDNPVEGRLVDICIRAAFGTSAAVRIVPAHAVPDAVSAILRFTTGG